jgi:hypothetical protein
MWKFSLAVEELEDCIASTPVRISVIIESKIQKYFALVCLLNKLNLYSLHAVSA